MKAVRTAVKYVYWLRNTNYKKQKKYKKISGKHKHTFINLELEAVHINREKGSNSMKTNKPQLIPVRSLTRN